MTNIKNAGFVSLHNHTQVGSPLDGLNEPIDLFERAKEIGQPGVAVTEHGSMASHLDCWKASKKTGIKMIPGMEAYFTTDLSTKKNNHLVLLAQNKIGYQNILRLNYEAYKNTSSGFMGKKTPRISWEHLSQFNEGVVALTACSNGVIAKALIAENNQEKAMEHMLRLKSIFGDRFFLELQPHALKAESEKNGVITTNADQVKLNETLIQWSREYDIEYVITCDAHYRDQSHAKYHDLMLAIKDKKAVDDEDRFRYGIQDMYLKTHEEIINFFGKSIATIGMANSIKIFNSCEEPGYLEPTGPILPKFPVNQEEAYEVFSNWKKKNCSNVDDDVAYLRYKCIEGFSQYMAGVNAEVKNNYWDRVKKELSVLEERGFSSYMLIVADYVNWAKSQGMLTGPGRGSVVGSLVAFLAGITAVDPLKYNLLFERFHNKEKKSFPDIDLDFGEPERVKQYLKKKYGTEQVASISNWSTETPKVIVKDVARSLRIGGDKTAAFQISNHITSIMPDTHTIEEAMTLSKEFREFMEKYPDLMDNASQLQNITRNWSVHAAGMVIADKPLYELIPLRIDEDGNIVTQYEKNRVEEVGLVKMDILGLKTLNVITDTISMIKENYGVVVDLKNLDLEDQEVYKMIGKGLTAGVFQLEASLTPLCMKIKPSNIQMISDINALGRPSCSPEQRQKYVDGRLGAKIVYRHPKLENALKATYGVSLYEEGMMSVAKDCAGWDLNKADALRKITKLKGKDPELVLRTEMSFIEDCMKHSGMKYESAQDIWQKEIEPFGKYGFNSAHSVAYSYISYWTAWLKFYYPTEFMCSLLNSEDPNSDKTLEYVNECSKLGIEITAPNVSKSDLGYKVILPKVIATGLSALKGVGESAISNILNNRPFTNLVDFFVRTEGRVVNKRVIEALAKAGATDCLGHTRKDVFENHAKYRVKINSTIKTKSKKIVLLKNIADERKNTRIKEIGPKIFNGFSDGITDLKTLDEFFEKNDNLDRSDFIGDTFKDIDDEFNLKINIEHQRILEEIIEELVFEKYHEEWDRKEILMNEKEVLGRAISGSLHEVFSGFFRKDSPLVTPLNKVSSLEAKSKIKIEVLINSKLKEIKIKNGPKTGRKFCKYIVADIQNNTAELTVWTEDYEKYNAILKDGTPIRAICKIDEYMGQKGLSLLTLENVFGKKI